MKIEFFETLKVDKQSFDLVHPQKSFIKYIYHPDFRVVFLFRFSQMCFRHRLLRPLAYITTMLNDFLHGVWIGPRVIAGPGLFLGHPRGLIINPSTKIGKNCSILQHVAIGGPNIEIGDFVEINAGAKIISNIRGAQKLSVGNYVTIAAGAVVVRDVPDCSVVAGVPGKVIKELQPEDNWYEFRKRSKMEWMNYE